MENPYIVVEQKQEKKRRGALAILLAIAFCAILAIGSTFAYLTWTANQTPNRVTTGELTADLLEPAYTTQAVSDNTDADGNVNATTGTLFKAGDGVAIPANAYSVVPGSQFQKNPFVVNTSKATTAKGYAGIKLEFQKWTGTANGDEGGSWSTMSQDEVTALMKVYRIDKEATNAADTAAGWGAMGSGWLQIASDGTAKDATTATNITSAPEMYFVNTTSLQSMGEMKVNNSSDYANIDNANDNKNWGYTLGGNFATSALFNYVTCVKGASQTNIVAVQDILKNSNTLASGKTFTPGWRIVCSGAILQDLGTPPAASDTEDFNKDMIAKLDDVSTTVNGQTAATGKPTKSTGMRENLNGNWSTYIKNNTITNANGLPEPSPNNL